MASIYEKIFGTKPPLADQKPMGIQDDTPIVPLDKSLEDLILELPADVQDDVARYKDIFRENNRSIKFIDPRGALDNQLTIFGDKFYDYAKIYQSLTGFESILTYKKINNEYNNSNRIYFENFFSNRFGKEKLNKLKILTSSLYITLIPLQPTRLKYKFFKIAKNLLNGN